MKHRVNLYLDELQPEICLVSPNLALSLWGLAIAVLAVLALSGLNEQSYFSEQKAQLDRQLESKRGLIRALEQAKLGRVSDPQLRSALEQQQRILANKERIRSELKRREALKYQGFSNLMLDLAEQHNDNLWLTRIDLDENKLRLQGNTVDSAAVPKWISSLSATRFFAGREFAAARLYRDAEDQPLAFVLDTEQPVLAAADSKQPQPGIAQTMQSALVTGDDNE